jgi:hypothetical protein
MLASVGPQVNQFLHLEHLNLLLFHDTGESHSSSCFVSGSQWFKSLSPGASDFELFS